MCRGVRKVVYVCECTGQLSFIKSIFFKAELCIAQAFDINTHPVGICHFAVIRAPFWSTKQLFRQK